MVDINNFVDINDFGSNLANAYHGQQLPVNDFLENIDENDLINFSNVCNDLDSGSSSSSPFFIETPPETPINQSNFTNIESISINSNVSLYPNENLLDFNSNYNEIISDKPNDFVKNLTTSQQSPISINGSTIATAVNYHQPTIAIVNCLSPIQLTANSSIDSSSSIVNGINFDQNSIRNCKVFDNHTFSSNNFQPKTILPGKVSNNKLKHSNDSEILKKQRLEARKLRNREAALNSRLKKKEHVENLEFKVKQLSKENNDLLLENELLKQKINDLEQELGKLRNLDLSGNYDFNRKKAKISFFAIAFMLFFQVSPYLMSISPSENNSDAKNVLNAKTKTHLSRTLLWKNGEPSNDDYLRLQDSFNSSYANNTKCGDYFNRTESIRLDNELRGWLTRFKLEENEFKRRFNSLYKSKQNTKKLLYDLKHVPIPRLKVWMQKQRYIDYINDELDHSLEQFLPYDLENLMSMIHRRDDTFYYLSYPSKGHLILPPMSNRTDIRPRFSFLIPTFYNFSLNGTTRQSQNHKETALSIPQLFMLQIDCQVVNTKITLVNEGSNHFVGNKSSVPTNRKLRTFKPRNNIK